MHAPRMPHPTVAPTTVTTTTTTTDTPRTLVSRSLLLTLSPPPSPTLTLASLTAPTAPTASHTDTSTTVARRPGRHTCAAPQFRRHTPFTPPTTRQSRNWQLKPPSSRPPRHHTTELSGPSSRGLEPGLFPHLCVVGVGRSTLQGVLPVLASLAQNQEAI